MILWSKISFYFNDFDFTMRKYFLLSKSCDGKNLGTVFRGVLRYILFFALGGNGEGFLFSTHTVICIRRMQWWNSVRDGLLVIEAVPGKIKTVKSSFARLLPLLIKYL